MLQHQMHFWMERNGEKERVLMKMNLETKKKNVFEIKNEFSYNKGMTLSALTQTL